MTIQTFDSIVMSLLFNMLSRFVIVFLLKSKRLLAAVTDRSVVPCSVLTVAS